MFSDHSVASITRKAANKNVFIVREVHTVVACCMMPPFSQSLVKVQSLDYCEGLVAGSDVWTSTASVDVQSCTVN